MNYKALFIVICSMTSLCAVVRFMKGNFVAKPPVAYGGTKGYSHPTRIVFNDTTQDEKIDIVQYNDSVFIRIVNENYSSARVIHKARIYDSSDVLVKMWNCSFK